VKRQYYIPSPVGIGASGAALLDFLRREFQSVYRGIVPWLQQKVTARYGQMSSETADPIADLGTTWQTVTDYDGVVFAEGIEFDPVAGTVTFSSTGVYVISCLFVLTHNEAGTDRTLNVRAVNLDTGGVTSGVLEFFTPKNTGGTQAAFSALTPIEVAGTTIDVQISSQASAYTGVVIILKRMTVQAVSA
jgi:hypothetical protein